MKKLKIMSMMLLAVMVLPLMVACGGDDDEEVTIIGTWTWEEYEEYYREYVFWEDNTCRYYSSQQQYYTESVGKYRISGNTLYLTFEKTKEYSNIGLKEYRGGSRTYTFKLTPRTLTLLRGTDSENLEKIEEGKGTVYKRK